jgi:hypothetical protein
MSRTLEFGFARYKGTVYSPVMVEVDEERRNVSATYEKRSLFKKERLQLTAFSYDERTAVETAETELRVGDLSLNSEETSTVSELASILRRPALEMAERNGKLYDELYPLVGGFVSARGAALEALKGVRDDPREAFVSLWAQAPPQEDNIVGTLLTGVYKPVEEKKAALGAALQAKEKELGASRAQTIYAAVFLLSRLQDSVFSGEETPAKEAYELADKMGLSQVVHPTEGQQLKMEDVTAKLLPEVSSKLREKIVAMD